MTMSDKDIDKAPSEPVVEETRVSPATVPVPSDAPAGGEAHVTAQPKKAALAKRPLVLAACIVVLLAALGGFGYAAGWFDQAAQDEQADVEQQVDEQPEAADASSADAADASADAANGADATETAPDQSDAAPGEPDQGEKGEASSASSEQGGHTSSGDAASTGSGSSPSSGSASGSSSGSAAAPSAPSAPAPDPKPSTITVSVSIDSSRAQRYDSSWPSSMGSRTVTLSEGATVYDALCAMGVSVGGSSYYVSSINGLAEKACGGTSGWTYSVNGVYPNKSCGRYVLSGGENVRWVYSTDADPTISY